MRIYFRLLYIIWYNVRDMTIEVPTIDGFIFRQLLAQSSRCALWRAEQITLERTVLVVVLGEEYISNGHLCDVLFKVVRAISSVNCCLIPEIIDVIRTDKDAYIILEDSHAENLIASMNGERLEPAQLYRIARALAEGFSALHSAHVVYGGLKPKALYLSEDGGPLLPDFTMAFFEEGYGVIPPEDELIGSPPYVAPEQYLSATPVDTRADMFAMGMTLYALATGQIPFGALPPEEILERKLTSTIPSPCDLCLNFPEPLAAFLVKLSQRNRDDRYADWDEVLFDLYQVEQGVMPKNDRTEDSVIAQPNPSAKRSLSERTIRLSVSDVRAYRLMRTAQKQYPIWFKLSALFSVITTLLLLAIGIILFYLYCL